MAIRVTQAAEYATRAMLYVASFPEGRSVLRSEIADAENIPHSFMAKILRNLVHAGLLRSCRGVHGGFALARPASEINLLQIVEGIEGPISLLNGSAERTAPDSSGPLHAVWSTVQQQIVGTLHSATLEELVSAPRRNGVVMFRPSVAEQVVGIA